MHKDLKAADADGLPAKAAELEGLRDENEQLRVRLQAYEERIRVLQKQLQSMVPFEENPHRIRFEHLVEEESNKVSLPPGCAPPRSMEICPVCTGDGGVTGNCRKCGGTGLV